MKLLTYLQQYHHYSRRQCTAWIQNQAIVYDGNIVESFGLCIQAGKSLSISGVLNIPSLKRNQHYSQIVAVYKPKWYVVSRRDPHHRTIYDIIDSQYHNRYYIGRLDKDSHGILLLTNDPGIVDQYEHPSHGYTKIYRVQIDQPITQDVCQTLCQLHYVPKEGGWYDQLSCDQVSYHHIHNDHILTITLHHGKKRHIRRLLQHLWYQVIDLCRTQCWEYTLHDIRPDLYLP